MPATPSWSGSRARALIADLRSRRLPCALCGQAIDYSLGADDPMSFSYDHIKARVTHPHLIFDPGNGQPAHLQCNKTKGAGASRPGIGQTSSGW